MRPWAALPARGAYRRRARIADACLVALLTLVHPAFAAQLPGNIDPGAQRQRAQQDLREQERQEREKARQQRPANPIQGPAGPRGGNLPNNAQVFTLQAIHFPKSHFLKADTLQAIAADYLHRPIRFRDLNAMLARINTLYRHRGIITAAAYIPPQTITDGALRVALLEGRLGKLEVRDAHYTDAAIVRRWLDVSPGDIVDVPRLRDTINRINRGTNLGLRASIQAGAKPGQSDLVVDVQEPPHRLLRTFIDNHGASSTGEWEGGVVGILNGPAGRGDRLTLYTIDSRGSRNGVLRYAIPVNGYGGVLDLSRSGGRIKVIHGPYKDLDVKGTSSDTALGYSQPLFEGPLSGMSLNTRLSRSESSTKVSGVRISDVTVREGEIGLTWFRRSKAGYLQVSQSVQRANVDAPGLPTRHFNLYPGTLSYACLLSGRWTAHVRAAWQGASDANLPSSIGYQLGGADTIRGYEQGAVSGGRGYRLTLGTDYRWQRNLSQSLFLDYGWVDQGTSGDTTLASVGTGLSWQWTSHLSIQGTLGLPQRTVTADQDRARADVRLTFEYPF